MIKKIIAIIPARGGSKSIPRKNLVVLCGKPLIYYSIVIAKKTPSIDQVIVDTDNEEIANVAKKFGADVPYLRPAHLAQDLTPDLPVFQHALRFLTKGRSPIEAVIHLRPTSPYRTVEYMEKAVKIFKSDSKTTCVRGVTVPEQNPYKMWRIQKNGFMKPLIKTRFKEAYNLPRQKLPAVFWQIGCIDIIRPDVILQQNSMTGNNIKPLFMEEIFATDIDTPKSLPIAQLLLKPYLSSIS